MTYNRMLGATAVAACALLLGACSAPDATSPTATALGPITVTKDHIPFEPEAEVLEVCKLYPLGATGPAVTVNYTFDDYADGIIDRTGSVVVPAGGCVNVAIGGTMTHEHMVGLTEAAPAGYVSTWYAKEYHAGVITTGATTVGTTATGYMHGDRGFTFIFVNRGAYGCSHGYWKAEKHADAWPAPYTPGTLFADVFEDAFPGLTMGEVLALPGGGLNALGRETVAGFLNAATGFYWYGTDEVVAMFNAAYPGEKFEYNALKDLFEYRNIAGCPLN